MPTVSQPILTRPGNSRRWKYVTPLQRFEEKYIPEPNSGCWLWLGITNQQGYGRFMINYRMVLAHRFAFQHYRGELRSHLVLDHLCRNRLCVNPDHLDQVDQDENMRRAAKDACRAGHPMTEQNSLVMSTTGRRQCRTCNNLRYLKRRGSV